MKTFLELRGTLKEGKLGKLPDPPPMVVMRRVGIRNFPNGEQIALYRNDKLNLEVSVPFSSRNVNKGFAVTREQLSETIVKKLEAILKKGNADNVTFANGTQIQVQPAIAKRLLDLKNKLKFTNRVGFTRHISASPKGLKDFVDFTQKELGH